MANARKEAGFAPALLHLRQDWLFAVPKKVFETQLFDAVFGF